MTSLGRGAAMQCDLIHPFFVHAFSMEKPSAMAPPVHNGTIERLGSAGPCERDMTTNESTKQKAGFPPPVAVPVSPYMYVSITKR